ncbi:MAG: hypothetical protein ACK5LX_02830 [Oscillospiraceae bacterium]
MNKVAAVFIAIVFAVCVFQAVQLHQLNTRTNEIRQQVQQAAAAQQDNAERLEERVEGHGVADYGC